MKNSPEKTITRLVGKAIGDFSLIEDGDRILVALSGGKDSWSLLYSLKLLQRKAPVHFELAAVTVHPGSVGINWKPLQARLSKDSIPHYMIPGQIVEVVNEKLSKGTNPCSFCSRLRRGMLYTYASQHGWNKIALGHHMDDFVETLFLNMFFNGSIKAMSPNLEADDGKNRIIRPLVYVRESMTREFAGSLNVPLVGCSCSYQEMSGSRRRWVKELLNSIEKVVPHVRTNILAAMGRIHHRHMVDLPRGDHQYISVAKA